MDEMSVYATLADLDYTNANVADLVSVQREDMLRVNTAIEGINARVDSIHNDVTVMAGSGVYDVFAEVTGLRAEIRSIKEALFDVQDMLRGLGLDDMSRRLGDLNLLLT